MAKNNELENYRNRVKGYVQRDILSDINYQNADLFKRNIYNEQIKQGLSYNQWQNNIRRQINDTANGILLQQQGGLTGSGALRQRIGIQQQAGIAVAGTANSFAQSQQQANQQITQANLTQRQIEEGYTQQEANRLYQEDIEESVSADKSRKRTASAVFGGLSALGSILSFIPFTAPLGLALDVIGGAGMVATSATETALNPTAGNFTQLGIDTLFAGLSIIPGINAVKNTKNLKTISNIPLGLPTPKTNFVAGKEGLERLNISSSIVSDLNNANTGNKLTNIAEKIGMTTKETQSIFSDVGKTFGKTAEEIAKSKDPNIILKTKNYIWDKIKMKSTFEKSTNFANRASAKAGDLIDSRRIISYAKSGLWSATKGVAKGALVGGARNISSNILNSYMPGESKELTATQITWRKIFDDLGIPQNLRPAGL